MRPRLFLLGVALLGLQSPAVAQDVDSVISDFDVQVHSFVSQGFLVSTANNYLANSSSGSFEFSEIGLNVTAEPVDNLRVGAQLFSRDLGPIGNYRINADWYYLDYRFFDWLGVRAGRTKIPFGFYNEVNDVDQGRLPILLPQSIYPSDNRDFLLAQTGGEIYGRIDIDGLGVLAYNGYLGTVFLDRNNTAGTPYEIKTIGIPLVGGGRLIWETPLDGLRIGGSIQRLRLDTDLVYETMPATTVVSVEIPATLWIASIEYLRDRWAFAAEYSRWYVDARTTDTTLFPVPSETSVSDRFFAGTSYRLTDWFQVGAYYSLLFPDSNNVQGKLAGYDINKRREGEQHDAALSLRFDINANWLIKLEGHYMRGTAALNSALNNNTPKHDLERDWGLFLIKTTAYF